MDSMFDLRGKVATVIGGTGAIGGAICAGLARAGADIAIVGRSDERGRTRLAEVAAVGARAMFHAADATNMEELRGALEAIEASLGPVEILINAQGVNSSTPFFEVSTEEWHRIIDTNLTSVFLSCQVFGQSMVAHGRGGSIINMSSASSGPPLSRVFTYSVTKAGVNSLTQYLANDLAGHGIRVNAIAPGFIPAEQNRTVLSPDRIAAILRHTPVGRLGRPDEVLGAVLWLASNEASSYVTGAVIHVDGGFSAMTI